MIGFVYQAVLTKILEKLNRDFDNLTPLSPRNTLLMDHTAYKDKVASIRAYPLRRQSTETLQQYNDDLPSATRSWGKPGARESTENLVGNAVPMGTREHRYDRSSSRDSYRMSIQPKVRSVGLPGRAL